MTAEWTLEELKDWMAKAGTPPEDAARSFQFVSDLVDAYYHRSIGTGSIPTMTIFQEDLRNAIQIIKTIR